jgi:hypothetical protein
MAALQIRSFGGITPKVPPRYLQDSQAQTALNTDVFQGSLKPLAALGSTVATLTKAGTPLTIYRYGQSIISDSQYWFHWTTDVDVCRSQIAGDTSEWTFYTGDGAPKATYNAIALSGSNYPTVSRPLGVPAPTTAAILTVLDGVATITLPSSTVVSLDVGDSIGIKLGSGSWTDVTISTATASGIASQLGAITGVDAVVDDGDVVITRVDGTPTQSMTLRYQTGSEADTGGAFTYNGALDKSDSGDSTTSAYVVITDVEIGSVVGGDVITVRTSSATHVTYTAAGGFTSAATFAAAINTASVVATAYGSCVVLTPGSAGGGPTDFIEYKRVTGATTTKLQKVDGSTNPQPARIFVTSSDMAVLSGNYAALTVNTSAEEKIAVPTGSTVSALYALSAYGVGVTLFGTASPFAVLETTLYGNFASLRLRAGGYQTELLYEEIPSGYGAEVPESRVYTYTTVSNESGFEFESAPAPASAVVSVYVGQGVTIGSFETVPAGYSVTHRRIYRATSGVYLFVAEIPVANVSYTDTILAEFLGEELPSLTWLPPPATLAGLINLPGGVMAGFTGRDVYFCDPYHPHAWPVQYMQSLDFPVVGLGRMDTTLAVMTTGTPYFIQGSSPDSMVVVKSDLEQSCVSKRSIVSLNGAVLYASPDGLVSLSPNGSKIITEKYFTRTQWQTLFTPSTIYAYQHDMKYFGFYNNGVTSGGFIYDTSTGEFVTHDIYAAAGYNDLQVDKLFLAGSDRAVKVWGAGANKTVTWKSKKFTLPQVISFSCAQLEAESYPMTAKIYAGGTLVHTQTVTSRDVFRLPATPSRDWEFQFEGSAEVFSFAVAQSVQELASV